nr:iron ABC transporter permease [Tomitella gaofuii]
MTAPAATGRAAGPRRNRETVVVSARDVPGPGRRASRRAVMIGFALAAALLAALGASVSLGSVTIPFGDVWAIVAHAVTPSTWWTGSWAPWWTPAREVIVVDSRLPRALTAACVGAALAVAGVVAQAVTRNALADPYLLGISSGAGFGVVLVIVTGLGAGALGAFTLPAAAFAGALLPLAGTIAVSAKARDVTAVILAGVAMSMVFSALITFFVLVVGDDHTLGSVMRWLAGGFGDARWATLAVPAAAVLLVGGGVMASGRWLNLLHAGDDGAAALGMNVRRFRLLVLLAVSLLTAAAVSVSGAIGFVGLLVPHAAGFMVGRNAVRLVPVAALGGALVLVLADVVARTVSPTTELPVGVVTAMAGGPVFLAMLWRQYNRRGGAR